MGQESIKIDESRAIEVITRTVEAKRDHTFIFKTQNEFPEEKFIRLTQEIGKEDENYPLNALFLITPLVRGDDTFKFFERITSYPLTRDNSWIFEPQKVVEANNSGVDVKEICRQTLRPGSYSGSYLNQWVHNCQILVDHYQGNVRQFFNINDNNAKEIIEKLIVKPHAKTKEKPEFRGFGPKIATLTVQWANQYFVPLEDANSIGIPVDFQVSRILIQTKAIDFDSPKPAYDITQKTILPLIKKICQNEGIEPRKVSEGLWLLGSCGCNHCEKKQRQDLCPIHDLCTKTISRKSYDNGGMFDPLDIRK